jgi:hypothetical protein
MKTATMSDCNKSVFLACFLYCFRNYRSVEVFREIKPRRLRWVGHVARMGGERKENIVLMGNPEGKRPLRRPRRRWENGIRMYLREIGWGGVEWIQLGQGRDRWRALVNAVMNLPVLAPRSYLTTDHPNYQHFKLFRQMYLITSSRPFFQLVSLGCFFVPRSVHPS